MDWGTMARNHWTKYLPQMMKDLEQQGKLQETLNKAVRQAQEEYGQMIEDGMYDHEAREIVLPKYILLTPESPDIV